MNCKPGDLAVVIGGFPENVGAVVTVLASASEETNFWGCQIWLVEVTGRPLKAMHNRLGFVADVTGILNMKDTLLRPVSGLPLNDDVKDEVTA